MARAMVKRGGRKIARKDRRELASRARLSCCPHTDWTRHPRQGGRLQSIFFVFQLDVQAGIARSKGGKICFVSCEICLRGEQGKVQLNVQRPHLTHPPPGQTPAPPPTARRPRARERRAPGQRRRPASAAPADPLPPTRSRVQPFQHPRTTLVCGGSSPRATRPHSLPSNDRRAGAPWADSCCHPRCPARTPAGAHANARACPRRHTHAYEA